MMYTMIADALLFFVVFFFNDTATTEIYTYGHTLSLHDALPISMRTGRPPQAGAAGPLRYLARPIAFSTLALSVSDCSMNLAKSGPAFQASPKPRSFMNFWNSALLWILSSALVSFSVTSFGMPFGPAMPRQAPASTSTPIASTSEEHNSEPHSLMRN